VSDRNWTDRSFEKGELMFRYSILIGSLLLILSACASSDTGSDSTAANASGQGGSVAATTVTQE